MKIEDKDLLLPAEKLLAKHKIEHGEAPAYNSEVLGLINQLKRMVLQRDRHIFKLKKAIAWKHQ